MLDPVQKPVYPVKILIRLTWKSSLECVLRVRTVLFPLQMELAKIKVVELGVPLLTERAPQGSGCSTAVRAACHQRQLV